jgi:sigma-E factor negative regulatory protein RseB
MTPGGSNAGVATDWIIVNPPKGFKLTVTRTQTILGAAAPVRHLVLSDGLASVSVFIEPINSRDKPAAGVAGGQPELTEALPELARVGAALAYSTEKNAHKITAVGEVPVSTLRAIAGAIQLDAGAPNAEAELRSQGSPATPRPAPSR